MATRRHREWARAVRRFRGVTLAHIKGLRDEGLGTPERLVAAGFCAVQRVRGLGPTRAGKIVELAHQWSDDALPSGAVPPWPTSIRRERRAAKMSQQELAELVGVTKMGVCHWELGRAVPTLLHSRRLERILPALSAQGKSGENRADLADLGYRARKTP